MGRVLVHSHFGTLACLVVGLLPTVCLGSDYYKYCCEILKCNNIIAACNRSPACRSSCAVHLSCNPVNQLAAKDYSCFQPFLNNMTQSALEIVCNQTYNPLQPPAAAFYTDYATCSQQCSGWASTGSSFSSAWTTATLQFILPTVIFSMTIPRQWKWEAGDWLFDFELNHMNHIPKAVVSLFCAGVIVVVDMIFWVLAIFVGAGPMLVGALHEAVIDYLIVQHLEDVERKPPVSWTNGLLQHSSTVHLLGTDNKVELMLAVLSGNLDKSAHDPQSILSTTINLPPDELPEPPKPQLRPEKPNDCGNSGGMRVGNGSAMILRSENKATWANEGISIGTTDSAWQFCPYPTLDISKYQQETISLHRQRDKLNTIVNQLSSILQSQYSFGSIVGAPVLFYLGTFIYNLVGLSQNLGDHDTAHVLAFGIWWMIIINVAIVSGCLLSSNNPSTVTAIVANSLSQQRFDNIECHRHHHIPFFMSPVYNSPFMPVSLWDRGRMKQMWIESTKSWKQGWFRRRIMIRIGWIIIPIVAFLLIFIPSCLAFIVSYTTPRICLGCRAFTFLIYTCSQLILIVATTHHTATFRERNLTESDHITCVIVRHLRSNSLMVRVISWFLILLAIGSSLVTAAGGTLLQMIGVYNNCLCSIPVTTWLITHDTETFNLASDTAADREASKYWAVCTYVAVGFMAFICYLGWWYQRYLRKRLKQRIQVLLPKP